MADNWKLRKKENHGPPQLLVLLWQHFCYYKRHWLKLIITCLLPFVFLFAIYGILVALTDGSLSSLESMKDCYYGDGSDSPLSAGPLQSLLSAAYYRDECQIKTPYSDLSMLDKMLRGHLSGVAESNTDEDVWYKQDNTCSYCNRGNEYGSRLKPCTALQDKILYFPQNEKTDKVMDKVKEKLKDIGYFFEKMPDSHTIETLPLSFKQFLNSQQKYKTCFVNVDERVLGFENLGDVTRYTKNISANRSQYDFFGSLPYFWGVVNFKNSPESETTKFRLISDTGDRNSLQNKIAWLQDLVTQAITEVKDKNKTPLLTYNLKQVPDKCWKNIPQSLVYALIVYVLPIAVVLSFIMPPANFLEQVLTEKELKLREYLYIMGVGQLKLKLSWILFYMIFLLPLSLIFALVVWYYPGGIFARTDPSFIFLTLILFNMSQLSFCYMLACALQSPQRTGILIGFLNVFFWILAASTLGKLELTGGTLVLARLTSLYSVTPLFLAIAYTANWEGIWIGAQWKNAFYSPVLIDQYGGVGECIMWLLADSVLYLIVAWYFEHVTPGEYGVRHPFYFPLQPSFWFPGKFKRKYDHLGNAQLADIEGVHGLNVGIDIADLSKHYTQEKIGVDHLSLTFYQKEVTAFLGENGAGKSTTMNCLVGLISPTAGDATVLGLNIRNQMDQIRQLIGFVPQYDILYPNMTVEEHLQFFAWLKGYSLREMKPKIDGILKRLDLENQRKNLTTSLSGGQKRKLSIITAYLGNPEIIILDEPTSGVDPFSRRTIWDMIQEKRRVSTTILSTHHMEEADLLGDRVAIICEGELMCSGTPMYLKNKYGRGFQIIVACGTSAQDKLLVKKFFEDELPQSKFSQEKGSDLIFTVPVEFAHSVEMVPFLKKLESSKSKLSVTSYGLSEPTMEEVFFSAIDASVNKIVPNEGLAENGNGIPLGNTDNQGRVHRLHSTSEEVTYIKRKKSLHVLLGQAYAMLLKKLFYTVFSWTGYLLQILLPLAFVTLLLLVGSQVSFVDKNVERPVHVWQKFRQNALFFQGDDSATDNYVKKVVEIGLGPRCPLGLSHFACKHASISPSQSMLSNPSVKNFTKKCNCIDYCTTATALEQPHEKSPSEDVLYRVGTESDISEWIVHANTSATIVIGGFQLKTLPFDKWNKFIDDLKKSEGVDKGWVDLVKRTTPVNYVNVWHKKELKLGLSNIWQNMELRKATGTDSMSIQTSVETLSLRNSDSDMVQKTTDMIQLFLSGFFLDLCFAFGTFGIAVFVQYENSTGLKRLQLLFGTNPLIYWLVNLLCDFLLYMVTVGVVMFLLYAVENSFQKDLGILAATVIPFGFMAITFTYLLSFMFRKTKGIVIFTVISFLVVVFGAGIMSGLEIQYTFCEKVNQLIETDNECMFGWSRIVSMGLRIIPAYYIVDSVQLIATYRGLIEFASAFEGFKLFDSLYDMDVMGQRILTACIAGVVYFILVVVLEYFDMRLTSKCCKPNITSARNPFRVVDADVLQEEQRVMQNQASVEPLIIKNLSKTYRGMAIPAVAGVTFGVPASQCFGLLGINGAGKTTLFKMLTGYIKPTSGLALLENRDLGSTGWGRLQGASYCPQDNTLFNNLTAKQHLQMFARIRGIPANVRNEIVNCLVEEVGLKSHLSKRASQLSGGNQRKLQFALSLLDYCPVIFLDEPTTGMDPGARRSAWEGIRRAVSRGCCVVLTSHSMEECEALCHRLVIMVAGSFQCIGSVQYLKDKFGNKYTFKLKISPTEHEVSEQSSAISVRQFIQAKYPHAVLMEEHATQLHFEISADQIQISELFDVLNQCKDQFPIEDFTLSQTTLEHVFVNMAKTQEMLHSGFVVQMPQPMAPQAMLPEQMAPPVMGAQPQFFPSGPPPPSYPGTQSQNPQTEEVGSAFTNPVYLESEVERL